MPFLACEMVATFSETRQSRAQRPKPGPSRYLAPRFQLDAYLDAKGQLRPPVAKGKVSWIRKVDGRGRIEVNGKAYFIRRRLSGQYVVATLFTHRQRLVIKQESKRIKSFPFPIQESRIFPLLSFIKGRS